MLRHLCQSVESHVEPLFCYIFSLFLVQLRIGLHSAQQRASELCIITECTMWSVSFPSAWCFCSCFFVCFCFCFFADDLSYMGSSETLVSIQNAFHRTVVVVLLLSVVPGTSNSDKKTWLWLAQYRASIWSSCTLPCYFQLYKAGDKCVQEFSSISL